MQLDRWYPAQCCQIQPERQYIFLWVFSTSRCFPERLIKQQQQQQQRGAIQNRLGFEKTAFLCIEKWHAVADNACRHTNEVSVSFVIYRYIFVSTVLKYWTI